MHHGQNNGGSKKNVN